MPDQQVDSVPNYPLASCAAHTTMHYEQVDSSAAAHTAMSDEQVDPVVPSTPVVPVIPVAPAQPAPPVQPSIPAQPAPPAQTGPIVRSTNRGNKDLNYAPKRQKRKILKKVDSNFHNLANGGPIEPFNDRTGIHPGNEPEIELIRLQLLAGVAGTSKSPGVYKRSGTIMNDHWKLDKNRAVDLLYKNAGEKKPKDAIKFKLSQEVKDAIKAKKSTKSTKSTKQPEEEEEEEEEEEVDPDLADYLPGMDQYGKNDKDEDDQNDGTGHTQMVLV